MKLHATPPARPRGFDRYEVEDAARTIARAEEHKRNPKLMREVKKHVTRLSSAVGAKPGR